ncbi:MAG: hypothetical protein OEW12_03295, partial [Deltaproteobacteria bacterium]|nr:hypothetical protein [Deltaproteobacteria bacterium]
MLQIDYSLIPLSDKDTEAINLEVTRKIKSGVNPKIDQTKYGRVIIINPDVVQTEHHIPDVLRTPLRRIQIDSREGQLDLPAARLYANILESKDPVYAVIIEIQSRFAYLHDLLPYLIKLRRKYPDAGYFFLGKTADLLEKFREILSQKDVTLLLNYPDARGTIDIEDAEEISQAKDEKEEVPSFAKPFFSQIRVKVGPGGKPIPFTLEHLRKL